MTKSFRGEQTLYINQFTVKSLKWTVLPTSKVNAQSEFNVLLYLEEQRDVHDQYFSGTNREQINLWSEAPLNFHGNRTPAFISRIKVNRKCLPPNSSWLQ